MLDWNYVGSKVIKTLSISLMIIIVHIYIEWWLVFELNEGLHYQTTHKPRNYNGNHARHCHSHRRQGTCSFGVICYPIFFYNTVEKSVCFWHFILGFNLRPYEFCTTNAWLLQRCKIYMCVCVNVCIVVFCL